MKELSVEQKARRYDEAIGKAKEMIKAMTDIGGVAKVDDIQYLFHELAESEDERIRKDLIIYLRSILSNKKYGDKFIESWIAWLEKQSEQKPANWVQELEDKLANATPKQLAEWKEKYFKEEPAEWSEEDKEMLDDIIVDVEVLKTQDKTKTGKAAYQREINWLKSLKERMQYQPHWKPNEEQLEAVKRASNGSRAIAGDDYLIMESLYNDLKKLREE